MMGKTFKISSGFFYWSLILILLTLPFPKYNINSMSMIACFVLWLFYDSWRLKVNRLKENCLTFLLLSSFFWIAIFGLIYTTDFQEGLKILQQKIPFLLLPIIFLTVDFNKKHFYFFLKYFSYSVLISATFALVKAFYFRFNNLGNYFYYDQFSLILEKHTTYYSLFVIVSMLFFANQILNKKGNKVKTLFFILYLFLILYFLSVRISILGLISSFLILIFRNFRISRTKRVGFLLIIIVTSFIYLTPNFQQRFYGKVSKSSELSDVQSRLVHWESVVHAISESNLLFGAGTGDGHLYLYQAYKNNDFDTGYIHEYNAHNQFLEIALFFGIIGIVIFLSLICYLFQKNWKLNNNFELAIIVLFLIYMSTESVLERQSGIVLFAYLSSAMLAVEVNPIKINTRENIY